MFLFNLCENEFVSFFYTNGLPFIWYYLSRRKCSKKIQNRFRLKFKNILKTFYLVTNTPFNFIFSIFK